jgi:hypothetical protein
LVATSPQQQPQRQGPSSSGGALGVLEYILRLAFFAAAPFGIVLLTLLVPMAAALVNMLLALAAFFFGELLIGAAAKRPWLKKVLGRQLAFEEYYRNHPPRPFLYYVFYPLFLPYWLFQREARREFLLFKGYTILTAGLASAAGVYRYFFVYQPELGAKHFFAAFSIGLLIESFAVMVLIMPMTTSVVALHRKKQHWRLVALLAVGLVSASLAGTAMAMRHRTFPSLETRQRVTLRTAAKKPQSKEAMRRALQKAWAIRKTGHKDAWEREDDGTVLGAPLDGARIVLESYYRPDEASAFELWTTSKREKPPLMVIFAEGRKHGAPVWLAMRSDGTVVDNIANVPKTARKAMRNAGDF